MEKDPKNTADNGTEPKANGNGKTGSETKKRGRPPKDTSEDPVANVNSSESNGKSDVPVAKKGRGRPPKDPEAHALKVKKPKVPGRGRGRPPKDPSEKAAKKSQGIFHHYNTNYIFSYLKIL